MSSIVLEPAIKEALLGDCQDFLCSKDWYVSCLATSGVQEFRGFTGTLKGVNSFNTVHCARKDAGIYGPVFGKGYPSDVGICYTARQEGISVSRNRGHILTPSSSGKTSLIYSIASELGLDIFVLILSSKG